MDGRAVRCWPQDADSGHTCDRARHFVRGSCAVADAEGSAVRIRRPPALRRRAGASARSPVDMARRRRLRCTSAQAGRHVRQKLRAVWWHGAASDRGRRPIEIRAHGYRRFRPRDRGRRITVDLGTDSHQVWKNDWLVKRFLDGVRGGIPHANDQIEVMMRLIAASGLPIHRFLDLGCGSGLLAIAVLAEHPEARVTLVDYSEPMMEAARDLLGADGMVPRFVLADLADPGWQATVTKDAPFDAVVSGFAIHHLTHERKRALYHEVFSLLQPGAVFVNI